MNNTKTSIFCTRRYDEWRQLKSKYGKRRPTQNEWKEISKSFTEKEKELFFLFRNEDCGVKDNLNISEKPHNYLGISKMAFNGRWRNIEFKAFRFFSANDK